MFATCRRLFCAPLLPSVSVIALAVLLSAARAQDPPSAGAPYERFPPVEPEQAVATFEVVEGFEMQLLAAEPLVVDPVDIAYDENGWAYVVEMRDYPYPEEKDAAPTEFLGKVRQLRDNDGDGRYDSSSIFAEDFSWPTAVICWQGGVFLAAAPDIWYLKDNDGDGQADVRRKVYTGFGRSNVQAIVNNLEWGPDHKIYGAASGNGGEVRPVDAAKEDAVSVARRDFRFDPRTFEVEAISGGARFGNTFDDWGNRFVCNIRNPVQHVVLGQHYLSRNRFLASSSVIHDAAESGDQLPVYSISPPEPWRVERAQRWTADREIMPRSELIGAGFWTSSSGVTVYRGSAFPADMYGNVFMGEVAGNLVHRQILERDGGTFRSFRADENTEFARSTDTWFRPVNFANAPDGTLHVLDMYRETIEHPWSIPDDIKARLDLQSGNDRGRIYRLCPQGFVAPPQPKLGSLASSELVRHLEHPSAWWRETAHRLLFERQDATVVAALRQLQRSSARPQTRLLALWSLVGLDALNESDVRAALADTHPEVRRNGVLLVERQGASLAAVRPAVVELSRDADPAVRMQVALTLGQWDSSDEIVRALADIALADADDYWIRLAVISSSAQNAPQLAAQVLQQAGDAQSLATAGLVQELCSLVAAEGAASVNQFLTSWNKAGSESSVSLQLALAAGLARGAGRTGQSLTTLASMLDPPARQVLDEWQMAAREVAAEAAAPLAARLNALELLGQQPLEEVGDILVAGLDAQQPSEVQLAAVRTLQRFANDEIATTLIEAGRTATPAVRRAVMDALLAREPWTLKLLDAMQQGIITPGEADLSQRARMIRSSQPQIAERAQALFGAGASTARADVVQQYQQAGRDLQLNPVRGAELFRKECMTCHKLGPHGGDVGPNLASVRHRSVTDILMHVLDPNRDVLPQFISYRVDRVDGRTTVGIIVGETDNSMTLRTADNHEETILRSEIDALAATGQSIMPEGFEQKLSPAELFDVIGYLLSGQQPAAPLQP